MKRFFSLFCACSFLLAYSNYGHTETALPQEPVSNTITTPQEPSIHWFSSLESAQKASENSNLPYYICFTGPEWCFWCQRLEKEIQSKPEFIQRVYDKFIFVQINIPKDPSQNDPALRDFMIQHKVYGVPVILILSHNLKEIGRLSYQNISPKDFANLALEIQ